MYRGGGAARTGSALVLTEKGAGFAPLSPLWAPPIPDRWVRWGPATSTAAPSTDSRAELAGRVLLGTLSSLQQ